MTEEELTTAGMGLWALGKGGCKDNVLSAQGVPIRAGIGRFELRSMKEGTRVLIGTASIWAKWIKEHGFAVKLEEKNRRIRERRISIAQLASQDRSERI